MTATVCCLGWSRGIRDHADGAADPGTRSHASASFLWLPHGTGPRGLTALSAVVLAPAASPHLPGYSGGRHIVDGREFQVQK